MMRNQARAILRWVVLLLLRPKGVVLVGDHWENAWDEDLSGREWNGVHYHGGPAAKDLAP